MADRLLLLTPNAMQDLRQMRADLAGLLAARKRAAPAQARALDCWVLLTSTNLTSGRYPGKIWTRDEANAAWIEGETCWIASVNGAALATGTYYRGTVTDSSIDPGGDARPVVQVITGTAPGPGYYGPTSANAVDPDPDTLTVHHIGPTLGALSGGSTGRRLLVYAAAELTLTHEDAGETATNRLACPDGADTTLEAGQFATLLYTGSRWTTCPLSFGAARTGWLPRFSGSGSPYSGATFNSLEQSNLKDIGSTTVCDGFFGLFAGNVWAGATALGSTTVNDYAGCTETIMYFTLPGNTDLTGLDFSNYDSIGTIQVIVNADATDTLTLKHEAAGSSAANRFSLPAAADLALEQWEAAALIYAGDIDGSGARWRLLWTNKTTAGADASQVTFTPASNGDWTGSADPGDLDDALNQLANRISALDTNTHPAAYIFAVGTGGTGAASFQGMALGHLPSLGVSRILANATGAPAAPQEVTATAVIDFIGTTRGAILYRGASAWSILSPGASGELLSANGAGADPTYIGIATALNGISTTQGVILYCSAGGWTSLATATAGYVLQTGGAGANPSWADATTLVSAASTSAAGKIEIATTAEVATGTDTARAVTPQGIGYHQGSAKSWVQFTGTGTVTIQDSYNITSITDSGTGNYVVNIATDHANDDFCAVASAGLSGNRVYTDLAAKTSFTVGGYTIITSDAAGTLVDADVVCGVTFGDW